MIQNMVLSIIPTLFECLDAKPPCLIRFARWLKGDYGMADLRFPPETDTFALDASGSKK